MTYVDRVLCCVLAVFIVAAPAAAFDDPPYLAADAIDLTALLPPPPAPASKAQTDDVAAVIAIQREASPERSAQAVADAEATPQRFAGDLLGPAFTPDKAPKTFALLARVSREGNALSEAAKRMWGRPRPFLVSDAVRCLIAKPTNAAYPSGHTIFAYEMAVILGTMIPDKREALLARAADYGRSRIIVGVHFPTDVLAGQVAGTVIAAMLLRSAVFTADLAEARDELRLALGH